MKKIVLSGIFYPMAILRYFEAALLRRDDVELFTVGPYTASWIPWNGGMHLPTKYAKLPDYALSSGMVNTPLPIAVAEGQLPWQPDAWIQIDAGFHWRDKPAHGKNIIVATDPHVLNYDRQREMSDTFFCMQTPYAKAGDEYLPYAYDPIWHAPEEQEQAADVCLLGLAYAERNALVNRLRDAGLRVTYDLGPCFDEARTLYAQAPIGFNWSSKQDLTARVFELLGMKRLAVVNWVPDLERFFEIGDHLIAFRSLEGAVEQILYFRQFPEEAKKVAARGHEQVKSHTWDARIEQILEAI